MSKATIACVWFITACATGGQGGGGGNEKVDAAVIRQDASSVTTPDAPGARLDGGVTPQPDAQVAQTPDAGSGLFCTGNSQCTVTGECCVTLGGPQGFCAPGTVVLGQCVPQ